jgi:ABC-type multidrug transport system fused ATPase/permease subunit
MKKIFKVLDYKEKLKVLILIFLILITSFLEILLLLFIQPISQVFLNVNNSFYYIEFFSFNYHFSIKPLFLCFIFIFLLRNIFYVLTILSKNSFIKRLYIDISYKIYSSYLKKDYSFFLKNNSSKIISNVINEVENFCNCVFDSFLVLLTEIFLLSAIILFLFFKFFLFSFILVSLCFLLFFSSIFIYKQKLKNIGLEKSSFDKKKINDLQKSFYAIQSIKLDGVEDYFINKFNITNVSIAKLSKIFRTFTDLHKPLWELLILLSFSISMYIGYNFFGLFRFDLILIIGTFIIAFFRFLPSLNRIFNCFHFFKFYSPSINFIYEELSSYNIFSSKEQETINNFKFSEQIELKNISFRYDDKNLLILDGINLIIKRNSITFIKGESGSGKSTLLNIICGLLFPTKGQVLVDNKNINDFLKSYRSKIGYVPQKTLLLEDSILDNIVFGQHVENLDLNLVKEVINKSKLNKLIDKLPNGLNTIVGERGSSLSGGEQQRIGIARALYKKPEILILDEATSALDEETERLLLKEILELQEFITIIMVSHKKLEIVKEFELFELRDNKIDHIKR